MSFPRAVAFLLRPDIEGVESDDPADDGGFTRFGISQLAHPGVDVKALTREQAMQLHLEERWVPVQGETWPWPVALALFDTAVMTAPKTAIRLLQQAVGAAPDGIIGPETRAKVAAFHPWVVMGELLALRLLRQMLHPDWPRYRGGWTRRALKVAIEGVAP